MAISPGSHTGSLPKLWICNVSCNTSFMWAITQLMFLEPTDFWKVLHEYETLLGIVELTQSCGGGIGIDYVCVSSHVGGGFANNVRTLFQSSSV
eukprot:2658503-Ditylum_brightwellii.AAC.1